MGRLHTDREYEGELQRLRDQILLMGARIESSIVQSMAALTARDNALAEEVIRGDTETDRMEVEIDGLCLRILAKRQPVASDLRFLTTALKLVTDLERIGDLCVNIAERAIELNAEQPLKPYIDLPKMAAAVENMIHDALDAFVRGQPDLAREVIARDRQIDDTNIQIFRELLTYMMEDSRTITRATRIQHVAKYLERIGDHATNLAEMVIFMAQGRDVRHTGLKGPRK